MAHKLKLYDPKSEELAKYFLFDRGADKDAVRSLAETIQAAIEDWFEECATGNSQEKTK